MRRKKTWFNGFSTGILSFSTPRLQQPDEESDDEERETDYAGEISEWNMQYL